MIFTRLLDCLEVPNSFLKLRSFRISGNLGNILYNFQPFSGVPGDPKHFSEVVEVLETRLVTSDKPEVFVNT